jgi:peptide deformylase
MVLPIVHYGHPTLLQKGAEIPKVTDAIRKLASDMLDTMYDANGVGLAAQQVGQALQLTVIDVRDSDRPSQLFLGAREVPVESLMPLVLINPKITNREGTELGTEGCLSFPELTGDIMRASSVQVSAMDIKGNPLQFMATGLLSRAVQHELDHLNGVLFIDRMSKELREELQPEITKLEKETKAALKKKKK